MAEHYVAKFSDVAGLSLAKNDSVSVGKLGFIYRVFDKLGMPVPSPLGATKKQGSFYLVPVTTLEVIGKKSLYGPAEKAMVVNYRPYGKFLLATTTLTGTSTQQTLQAYYNKEAFAKVNNPHGTGGGNYASLYGELSGITFTNYGLVMFNDQWFYGKSDFTNVRMFNLPGKSDFGAAIDYVAIPNR